MGGVSPEMGVGEYVLDTPLLRAFVGEARAAVASAASPEAACDTIRPSFADLLADPEWLPAEYRADAPGSGMGGGIGQWLLYRAGDLGRRGEQLGRWRRLGAVGVEGSTR